MIATSLYSELTPNPNTIKFVADRPLANKAYEFTDPDQVTGIALLEKLYNFPFIDGIFVMQNFITLKKNDLVEWTDVSLELREYVLEYLQNNQWVIEPNNTKEDPYEREKSTQQKNNEVFIPLSKEELREVDLKIIDILDEYVTPAVAQDGGDIVFKHFNEKEGRLTVSMKGACNGCPSSTVTLKQGIQALFNKMMPEVKEVVAD